MSVSGYPATILLVNDDAADVASLQVALTSGPYQLRVAHSGAEAISLATERSIDLMLAALPLPDIPIADLMTAVCRDDPESVVVTMVPADQRATAMEALRQGAFGYLLRPFDAEEVRITVERALEKRRLSEAVRHRVGELEQMMHAANLELAQRVRELQESRFRLDAVIDSMKDGLVVYDGAGRAIRANAFMLSLFDLAPDDIVGRSASQVAEITGEPPLSFHQPALLLSDGREESQDRSAVFEVDGVHKRYLRRVVSPVIGHERPVSGMVVIYQDITDQKEVEQLKDDFLSIASHELKTPLTSIMGYTQLLARRLSRGVRLNGSSEVITVIENQCRRMKRLVEDLLDVSRIERGALQTAPTDVDLLSLVDAVVAKFRATSPEHIFKLLSPNQPVRVWADEDRLDQVLTNLLSNAVKYSPDGGKVEVRVNLQDGCAEISVRDWGIGIPYEQQSRIFNRFYQAETLVRSRRFGGMGLGLFISKAIIDEMGGHISVESAVGQGSTFRFTLPVHT